MVAILWRMQKTWKLSQSWWKFLVKFMVIFIDKIVNRVDSIQICLVLVILAIRLRMLNLESKLNKMSFRMKMCLIWRI